MEYIKIKDEGQDILWIKVNNKKGIIVSSDYSKIMHDEMKGCKFWFFIDSSGRAYFCYLNKNHKARQLKYPIEYKYEHKPEYYRKANIKNCTKLVDYWPTKIREEKENK